MLRRTRVPSGAERLPHRELLTLAHAQFAKDGSNPGIFRFSRERVLPIRGKSPNGLILSSEAFSTPMGRMADLPTYQDFPARNIRGLSPRAPLRASAPLPRKSRARSLEVGGVRGRELDGRTRGELASRCRPRRGQTARTILRPSSPLGLSLGSPHFGRLPHFSKTNYTRGWAKQLQILVEKRTVGIAVSCVLDLAG